MADIFLSYASEDRERVAPLVDAIRAWERGVSLDSQVVYMHAGLGYGYARAGRIDEAKAVLERVGVSW